MSENRVVDFTIAADTAMHQWARQESAPPQSVLIAHHEIAARRRGGMEWRVADAVAVCALARPDDLDPASIDLPWIATGLGAARALDDCFGPGHTCRWPDAAAGPGLGGKELSVSTSTSLGPGRVDYATMTVRVGPAGADRQMLIDRLVEHLRDAVGMLDEPDGLVAEYQSRCDLLGERVAVSLVPSGSARGIADRITGAGHLVLVSPTGLEETVPVASLGALTQAH